MKTLTWIALLALAGGVHAHTVWRCGTDTHPVYTDERCADGRALAAADPRTPDQVQAAQRAALAETQRAQRLVHEREAREQAQRAQGSGLIGIGQDPRDLFRKSTTLSKKKLKSSKRLGEASIWPATVRATRRARD